MSYQDTYSLGAQGRPVKLVNLSVPCQYPSCHTPSGLRGYFKQKWDSFPAFYTEIQVLSVVIGDKCPQTVPFFSYQIQGSRQAFQWGKNLGRFSDLVLAKWGNQSPIFSPSTFWTESWQQLKRKAGFCSMTGLVHLKQASRRKVFCGHPSSMEEMERLSVAVRSLCYITFLLILILKLKIFINIKIIFLDLWST